MLADVSPSSDEEHGWGQPVPVSKARQKLFDSLLAGTAMPEVLTMNAEQGDETTRALCQGTARHY